MPTSPEDVYNSARPSRPSYLPSDEDVAAAIKAKSDYDRQIFQRNMKANLEDLQKYDQIKQRRAELRNSLTNNWPTRYNWSRNLLTHDQWDEDAQAFVPTLPNGVLDGLGFAVDSFGAGLDATWNGNPNAFADANERRTAPIREVMDDTYENAVKANAGKLRSVDLPYDIESAINYDNAEQKLYDWYSKEALKQANRVDLEGVKQDNRVDLEGTRQDNRVDLAGIRHENNLETLGVKNQYTKERDERRNEFTAQRDKTLAELRKEYNDHATQNSIRAAAQKTEMERLKKTATNLDKAQAAFEKGDFKSFGRYFDKVYSEELAGVNISDPYVKAVYDRLRPVYENYLMASRIPTSVLPDDNSTYSFAGEKGFQINNKNGVTDPNELLQLRRDFFKKLPLDEENLMNFIQTSPDARSAIYNLSNLLASAVAQHSSSAYDNEALANGSYKLGSANFAGAYSATLANYLMVLYQEWMKTHQGITQ